ncbi:MAG: hypothetical protein OXG29_00550 [Gammaproteobacteria bacterium]|nr:hypothetical protein [Gammaproteobacteria bacterium]
MAQTRLNDEFAYYLAHQEQLVSQHNGKCVVIKNKKIIGVYDNYLEAVKETIRQGHQAGTFLTQRVSPGEKDYTSVFHSRVAFS